MATLDMIRDEELSEMTSSTTPAQKKCYILSSFIAKFYFVMEPNNFVIIFVCLVYIYYGEFFKITMTLYC
jgi:hypothetical protein